MRNLIDEIKEILKANVANVADVVPTGTGPNNRAPIGAPVSRLTGEQPAPQRGGSRLSRMLKRIPKRSMSM